MVFPTLKVLRMPYPDLVQALRKSLKWLKAKGDQLDALWLKQGGIHLGVASNNRLANSRSTTPKVTAMYQKKALSVADRASNPITLEGPQFEVPPTPGRHAPLLNVLRHSADTYRQTEEGRTLEHVRKHLFDVRPSRASPQPKVEIKANRMYGESEQDQLPRRPSVPRGKEGGNKPSEISMAWDGMLRESPRPTGKGREGKKSSQQVDSMVSRPCCTHTGS